MTGIVYCLTNPEMPDLVKIGMTADLEAASADTRQHERPRPV